MPWLDKSLSNSALSRALDGTWPEVGRAGYLPKALNKESRAGNVISSLRNCLVCPAYDQIASNTRTIFLTLYHRFLAWGREPDIVYFQICRFLSVWQCRGVIKQHGFSSLHSQVQRNNCGYKIPCQALEKTKWRSNHRKHKNILWSMPMTYATWQTSVRQSQPCAIPGISLGKPRCGRRPGAPQNHNLMHGPCAKELLKAEA